MALRTPASKPLIPAGAEVAARLAQRGKSQTWLVDEMNRLRRAAGILTAIKRAGLWRWMVGETRINVDDATLIEGLLGVPATLWSQHAAALAPARNGSG